MVNLTFPLRRTFLALPLENDARAAFRSVQHFLEPFDDLLRFQNPNTAHLTLYFWPEVMEIEYKQIVDRMRWMAERTEPFTMHTYGIEAFERKGLPQVLYLAIDRCEPLATLKKLCPWPNTRPFAPHITMARIKKPNAFKVHEKKIMKSVADVSFDIPVDSLRLYAEVEDVRQTEVIDIPLG